MRTAWRPIPPPFFALGVGSATGQTPRGIPANEMKRFESWRRAQRRAVVKSCLWTECLSLREQASNAQGLCKCQTVLREAFRARVTVKLGLCSLQSAQRSALLARPRKCLLGQPNRQHSRPRDDQRVVFRCFPFCSAALSRSTCLVRDPRTALEQNQDSKFIHANRADLQAIQTPCSAGLAIHTKVQCVLGISCVR